MKAKSPSYLVELLVQGSAWHVSLVTASTTIPRLRIISGMWIWGLRTSLCKYLIRRCVTYMYSDGR